MKFASLVVAWNLCVFAWANSLPAQVVKFELDNGIQIIVNPIPNVDCVGVETFYEVGFADEPQGMVQSSHLLEHLVCYSPGAGFQVREAMKWLNEIGVANAETMLDATHYDYAADSKHLDKILEIEAARLRQTEFSPNIISTEAKRVYQETDFVENNPAAGMLKHGFMALFHAWKYQAKTALVRGGLDDMDPKKLKDFHRRSYLPRNLTIAITGNTTGKTARKLVKKHFGQLKNAVQLPEPLDWTSVPKRHTIGWDSHHRAVCVAWNPPKSKRDQVWLSLLGAAINQGLLQDKQLKQSTEIVFCSNNMWMVGDAPWFIYALAKPGADLEEVEDLLTRKFIESATEGLEQHHKMVRSFGFQLEFQKKQDSWPLIKRGIQMLKNSGRSDSEAVQMAILQDALSRCTQARLLGTQAEKIIASLKGLSEKQLEEVVKRTLKTSNQHVVYVVPQD